MECSWGRTKGAIRQHTLKVSKDFHMKEAWEGLQRAGHSGTSSGLASSEGFS